MNAIQYIPVCVCVFFGLTVLFLELLITQGAADMLAEVCQKKTGGIRFYLSMHLTTAGHARLTCELDSPVSEVCAVRE